MRETHADHPFQAGAIRESPAASTGDTPLFDSPSGGSESAMAPTVGDRPLRDASESTAGTVPIHGGSVGRHALAAKASNTAQSDSRRAPSGLHEVEAVEHHHLVPCSHKVPNKLP